MKIWQTIIWTDADGRQRMDKVRAESFAAAQRRLAKLDPEYRRVLNPPARSALKHGGA
ncbi:MAG: hypothetical protein ACYS7Y_30490 [Planctomycetota bacterium]|jgi:hypothetical protein